MLLMVILTAGYYFIGISDIRRGGDNFAQTTELKSVLSCLTHAHSGAVSADEKQTAQQKFIFPNSVPCVVRYNIKTEKVCLDGKELSKNCVPDKIGDSFANYIISGTDVVTGNGAGKALRIMGSGNSFNGNVGVISIENDNIAYLLTSGGVKREIPAAIATEMNFSDGQLVSITQYNLTGKDNPSVISSSSRIKCSSDEKLIFRQNRWECAKASIQQVCSGDYIWDYSTSECIPDASKRPLCSDSQTAVMSDGIWQCIDPEPSRECPSGYVAQFDYDRMGWFCVQQTAKTEGTARCEKLYSKLYGGGGTTTLRGSLISCNDCEQMVVHDDCTAECIPDATATTKSSCYSGTCNNFYFGFPDTKYITTAQNNISSLSKATIPLDEFHSKNRRFNCMECPKGVNELASVAPYVIVCK